MEHPSTHAFGSKIQINRIGTEHRNNRSNEYNLRDKGAEHRDIRFYISVRCTFVNCLWLFILQILRCSAPQIIPFDFSFFPLSPPPGSSRMFTFFILIRSLMFRLNLTPDPAVVWIALTSPDNVSSGALELAIYNLFGQGVVKSSVVPQNRSVSLNISNLSSGFYLAVCKDGEGKVFKGKFVVAR